MPLKTQCINSPDARHPQQMLAWPSVLTRIEGLRMLTQLIGNLPAGQTAAVCLWTVCLLQGAGCSSKGKVADQLLPQAHQRGTRVSVHTWHGAAHKTCSTACKQIMAAGVRGLLSAGLASRAGCSMLSVRVTQKQHSAESSNSARDSRTAHALAAGNCCSNGQSGHAPCHACCTP